MPLWPLLFLGVAAELAHWRKPLSIGTASAILGTFALTSWMRCDTSAFARDVRVPAVSTRGLARLVVWGQKRDPDALLAAVERAKLRPPEEREELLFVIGTWLRFWTAPTSKLSKADEPHRAELARTRELLRQNVAPREQIFFAAPANDEIVQVGEDLESFWARHGGRPQN
jgi:hypothetical protein